MKLGMQSLQFLSNPSRSLADQFEEALPIFREANRLGFDWISASQHWISAPTIWPQPFPVLARLVPEVPDMRLMTQMLILPLHNPVDVAEQVATLDQLSRGRLTLGMAIGYREVELKAAGITRADRVRRMEEGIDLMRRLWSGKEVKYEGKWTTVDGGQMGFTCFQQPHPPIILAAQSQPATRRAARLGDGVFFGPQIGFEDLRPLIALYRDSCDQHGREPGLIGAGRSVMLGDTKEDAVADAGEYSEKTVKMYDAWDMQERGMVELQLEDDELDTWAIVGSAEDCVDAILSAHHDIGLNGITLTPYNLPSDPGARLEYVQRMGEEIVAPVKRALA